MISPGQLLTVSYELSLLNKQIKDDIRDELRLQGHFLTGELDRSFTVSEEQVGDSIVLSATALLYVEELEKGVPANLINADVNKVAKWVLERNLTTNFSQAKTIAFLIIRKWKKVGKPLETSKEFSSTGEILHAMQIAFDANQSNYIQRIDSIVFGEIDKEFFKTKSGKI